MTARVPDGEQPAGGEVCKCPVNRAGDIPCHICGQYVNRRCWNCGTPRGEGPCPTRSRRALDGA